MFPSRRDLAGGHKPLRTHRPFQIMALCLSGRVLPGQIFVTDCPLQLRAPILLLPIVFFSVLVTAMKT